MVVMTTSIQHALNATRDVITSTVAWARETVSYCIAELRPRRAARIEAELDRKQDELRATILSLAEALGADAHEARKALIRESYLASGKVPGHRDQ